MGHSLIDWLDATPARFWVVAISATILWSAATLAPWSTKGDARIAPGLRGGRGMLVWSLATLLLLLAWRWPYLVGPALLNPDEAQMIAGAITLKDYPLYWKYVDGTTRGPLADFALVAGWIVGLPLNYGGARAMAGLLTLGGLLLTGRALMLVYPPRAVRIALAAPLFLWAGSSFYDFTGFTSESVPVFLILASFWPAISAFVREDLSVVGRSTRLATAGLLIGSLPYAKLQSVPIGAALGLALLVATVFRWRSARGRERWMPPAALVGGALLPTFILVAYLWIWGLGNQFWMSYVEHNRAYAATAPVSFQAMLLEVWGIAGMAAGLQSLMVFALIAVAFAALGIGVRGRRTMPWVATRTPHSRRGLRLAQWKHLWPRFTPALATVAAVLLVASVVAVIAPRRPFSHYLQFLVPPLACILVIVTGNVWLTVIHEWEQRRRHVLGLLIVTGMLVPMLIARANRPDPDMRGLWTANRGEWRSPAGIAIGDLAQPGDSLCVWGWMPAFYVESGLPHATREAHTYAQLELSVLRDFFRERFIRDFQRSAPRIFVDAVGGANFGYSEPLRATHSHENFPELAAIIAEKYDFVREVAGSRIYLRRAMPAGPRS